jgi:hypothetical protein
MSMSNANDATTEVTIGVGLFLYTAVAGYTHLSEVTISLFYDEKRLSC